MSFHRSSNSSWINAHVFPPIIIMSFGTLFSYLANKSLRIVSIRCSSYIHIKLRFSDDMVVPLYSTGNLYISSLMMWLLKGERSEFALIIRIHSSFTSEPTANELRRKNCKNTIVYTILRFDIKLSLVCFISAFYTLKVTFRYVSWKSVPVMTDLQNLSL